MKTVAFTFIMAVLAVSAFGQKSLVVRGGVQETRIPSVSESNALHATASNAVAAALVEAELALAPKEFPTGIAVPDSTGTNPVWEIGVDNGVVVAWQAHASPYKHSVAESNRLAALVELDAMIATSKLLIGVAQTNKNQMQGTANLTNITVNANLTNGVYAKESRTLVNDMRRELIDTQDALIETIRLFKKYLKDQN